MMLSNKEMLDMGYSQAFRCCFDLLAKYADAEDKPDTWDQCCTEAVEIYDQFKTRPFAPMVSKLLQAVFDEIGRLYEPETVKDEGGKNYRFTI